MATVKVTGLIYSVDKAEEKALEGVTVLLFDVKSGTAKTAITDRQGKYTFDGVGSNDHEIVLSDKLDLDGDGVPELSLFRSEDATRKVSVTKTDQVIPPCFYRPTLFPKLADRVEQGVDSFTGAIKDVSTYPFLTQPNSYTMPSAPNAVSASGGASLSQIIDGTLRQVLGWRPHTSDPKGFVAALNQSFTLVEEAGKTEWEWKPHTYTIQADLGAVTGAQASIFARAKVILDQSLPLLHGLKSLLPDFDPEDTEASKVIVESSLTELVGEMGLIGGPRVQRVDSFFFTLLGEKNTDDPEQVDGQLGRLRKRLGLERQRVNTVEEEQNLTNFRILGDNIISLKQSWDSQRRFFDRRGTDVFLGTHLVLLSRALTVLGESVQEAYLAMDSVFLRDAERQAIPLPLGKNQPTLTIAELLEWVERFASKEGPRLIREAGKDGALSFRSTVKRLHEAVSEALAISQQPSGNPVKGFHTPRVQRTLAELQYYLEETLKLVGQLERLPAPIITTVDPNYGVKGQTVRVTLDGKNLQDVTEVKLSWSGPASIPDSGDIPGENMTVVNSTQIRASFNLTKAAAGSWQVMLTPPELNEQSSTSGMLSIKNNVFTVYEALEVKNIKPLEGKQGSKSLSITITGRGFQAGATIDFGRGGILVKDCQFDPVTQNLTAQIDIDKDALLGVRDVTVTNPGEQPAILKQAFKVLSTKPPDVDSVTPDKGYPGNTLHVIIGGKDFQKGATVAFGQEIAILQTEFKSDKELEAIITIADNANAGKRPVTVTNLDRQYNEKHAFEVNSSQTKGTLQAKP